MSSESHGENIGNDRFALRRFQTRAMRHAVDDVRPIFGAVTPEQRQRVAFDAAMDEKRAAFAQHRKIDMLSLSRSRHLRSNRRHEVCRFAVEQREGEKKAGKLTHVWRDSYDKLRPVVSASRNIRPDNSSHL